MFKFTVVEWYNDKKVVSRHHTYSLAVRASKNWALGIIELKFNKEG